MGRSTTSSKESAGVKSVGVVNDVQAGDLIYRTSNGYGVLPSNFVASAEFESKQTKNISNGKLIGHDAYGYVRLHDNAATQFGKCMDTLSNGNIVLAYRKTNKASSNDTIDYEARIYDTSYNLVQTVALNFSAASTPVFVGRAPLHVKANPNGGFCVAASYSTNGLQVGVYDNAGVQQGSTMQQNSCIRGYQNIDVAINSTNQYVIAITESGGANNPRIFITNTGYTAFSTNSIITSASAPANYLATGFRVFVRSDDSIRLIYRRDTNVGNFVYLNSTGTYQSQQTFGTGGWAPDSYYDSTEDATYYFHYTPSSTGQLRVYKVTETTQTQVFSESPASIGIQFRAEERSAATFVTKVGTKFWCIQTCENTATYWVIEDDFSSYQVYEEPTAQSGICPSAGWVNWNSQNWFFQGASSAQDWTDEPYKYCRGVAMRPGTDTGLTKASGSLDAVVATASQAPQSYAKSGSSPANATFLASTTDTSGSIETTAILKEVIASLGTTSRAFDVCPAPNGGCHLALIEETTGNRRLITYDNNGTQITNKQIGTQAAWGSTVAMGVQLVRVSDSKVAFFYPRSQTPTVMDWIIFDDDGNELNTGNEPLVTNWYSNLAGLDVQTYNYQAIGSPSHETGICICYGDTSQYQPKIEMGYFDDSTNSVVMVTGFNGWPSPYNSGQAYYWGVGLQMSGDMVVFGYNSTYGGVSFYYDRSGETTWTSVRTLTAIRGTANANRQYVRSFRLNDGSPVCYYYESGGEMGAFVNSYMPNGTLINDNQFAYQNTTSGSPFDNAYFDQCCYTVTGNGSPIFVNNRDQATLIEITAMQLRGYAFNGTTQRSVSISTSNKARTTDQVIRACAAEGNNIWVAVRTTASSDNVTLMKIRAIEEFSQNNIVAGTTVSKPVAISSGSAVLAGVSTSAATAGNSVIIQSKGAAQLSNDYPTGTSEGFDFRTRTADGVQGTATGRSVIFGD